MAWCPTAPSHYLNQCWLIIREVPWHSSGCIIIRRSEEDNQYNKIQIAVLKWHPGLPGDNELMVHLQKYVLTLVCFVGVIDARGLYQHASGLLHWGHHTIAQMPVKQPWIRWLNSSDETTKKYWCERKNTKQSHVRILWHLLYLLTSHLGPLLLTWFNYNSSMDK